MSNNVIALSLRQKPRSNDKNALLQCFAKMRRDPGDVFWLKENAEILNIFECSKVQLSSDDLRGYTTFYDQLPDRMAFFPQYYRFFASIACDLEALGVQGDTAQGLCDTIDRNGLVQAELSDLQRAETMRLLARRGIVSHGSDALRTRLHSFINHSPTFALPNRKASYELTHIVFYLSEYGRLDPKISAQAVQSLIYAGILAQLDQNVDLLAEVCIALRNAGQIPPAIWDTHVKAAVASFEITQQDAGAGDNYHEYLVTNWAVLQTEQSAFEGTYSSMGSGFYRSQPSIGALGQISEVLMSWDGPRHSDWHVMEDRLYAALDAEVGTHLMETVDATPHFAEFFEHFSRPQAVNPLSRASKPTRLQRV